MKPTSNYTNTGKLQALRESNTREQQALGHLGAPYDATAGAGGGGGGGGGALSINTSSTGFPPSSSSSSFSASPSWSGAHTNSNIMGPPEAVHLFQLQSFLLATLAHLPFDFTEEPLQVNHLLTYSLTDTLIQYSLTYTLTHIHTHSTTDCLTTHSLLTDELPC